MSLKQTLAQIDDLKKQVDKLRPLKEEAARKLWDKLRLEWNYNSNHIEGNTLTYGETVLLLRNGKTTGDHNVREFEEMKAHDLAVHDIREWAQEDRDITEADIRQLNKTILKEPFWKEAITEDGQPTRRLISIGEYKKYHNSVRLQTGEIFHYVEPSEVPQAMQELMGWYRSTTDMPASVLAAELHYRFVRIHPFDDGNGRVARLLVNYVLMKNGYPPVIIKSADKAGYLTALEKADAGDREAFHDYIAEQLIWSLNLEISAAKGEDISEADDVDKKIHLLAKELKTGNILETPGTSSAIVKVVAENIIPLAIEVEKKCAPLTNYFFQCYRGFSYIPKGKTTRFVVGTNKSDWNVLKENWLYNQIRDQQQIIGTVIFEYHLEGFKKNIKAHNFLVSFEVYFSEYNYRVQTTTGTLYEKIYPYDRMWDANEFAAITKPLLEDLIERIKQASK